MPPPESNRFFAVQASKLLTRISIGVGCTHPLTVGNLEVSASGAYAVIVCKAVNRMPFMGTGLLLLALYPGDDFLNCYVLPRLGEL